ncbi:hypothetical protein [Polaribacter sp.]|uniref:hypothetical protein n=1 Tax=Polaribacter sp. TaxID=1920175 RepID=UPI003EF24143
MSTSAGLKQMDTVTVEGNIIIDFSLFNAIQAGIGKVVFIIRKSFLNHLKALFNKKVAFNLEYYQAYEKGFLEKTKDSLSATALKYLPLAAKTMIFIIALRFLRDYLNNAIYYKTNYAHYNLDRAKNQFKWIASFSEKNKYLKIIN